MFINAKFVIQKVFLKVIRNNCFQNSNCSNSKIYFLKLKLLICKLVIIKFYFNEVFRWDLFYKVIALLQTINDIFVRRWSNFHLYSWYGRSPSDVEYCYEPKRRIGTSTEAVPWLVVVQEGWLWFHSERLQNCGKKLISPFHLQFYVWIWNFIMKIVLVLINDTTFRLTSATDCGFWILDSSRVLSSNANLSSWRSTSTPTVCYKESRSPTTLPETSNKWPFWLLQSLRPLDLTVKTQP